VADGAELLGLLPKEGEDHRGNEKMQRAAKSNFVLTESFSLELELLTGSLKASRQGEFYQQIAQALIKGVRTKEALTSLGERLTKFAHYAYSSRQMDVVEQVSQVLMNLPLGREIRNIARYYQAFCIKRRGQFSEARNLFERVADEGPLKYRARAIIALGSIAFDSGDFQSALPLYLEGNHAAIHNREFDPLAAFYASHMLAVINSIDGNHRGSLADLERMLPLARAVGLSYPPLYYIYLNSLAVEKIEVGQMEEARNLSKIVLATPYANAYSEWHATSDEIEIKGYRASRSVVVVHRRLPKSDNVVSMPVREHSESISSQKPIRPFFHQQAGVTFIREWKANMVKKRNGDKKDDKPKEELDDREMLLKIVQISTKKGLPDVALQEMVDALENIAAKYAQKDDKTDK
jgi:tetratricopeptide (TPR) repeat protein